MLLKNAPNPVNVLGNKGIVILLCSSCVLILFLYGGVGEPPLVMSCSVLFAAIENARAEIGIGDYFSLCEWNILMYHNLINSLLLFSVAPVTVEKIQLACLVEPSQFTI